MASPTRPAEPLGRRAYRVLRQAIRDGVIQQQRFYSESELADLLGVSRTPVREALKALERDGVLETARRRGYRLRDYGESEVEEMAELRKRLERFAVTRLVETAGEAEVGAMREAVERQREPSAADRFFGLDEDFHLMLADLARLPRTRSMLAGLRSAMAIVVAGAHVSGHHTARAVDEHDALVTAVARRDLPEALRLLDAHIERATLELLKARRSQRQSTERLLVALDGA